MPRTAVPVPAPAGRAPVSPARGGRWTAADVPSQAGRTAVVTGASDGLGLVIATVLAQRDATVVLACRDLAKAGRAAARIRAAVPAARLEPVQLDLASQASVRAAAAQISAACPRLDLLIANAAVMRVPWQRTEDGFELTFATNHLGHFTLTGLLLDRLLAASGSRIVTVSSLGHLEGVMRSGDLMARQGYQPMPAYWQSKLANLLFTYELNARLAAAGAGTTALAAHPGVAATALWRTSSRLERTIIGSPLRLLVSWLVQSAAMGALPVLRAATDPAARGGEYYGPGGWREYTGYPVRVESSARSHDEQSRRRLWEISQQLTGVVYPMPAPAGQHGPGGTG